MSSENNIMTDKAKAAAEGYMILYRTLNSSATMYDAFLAGVEWLKKDLSKHDVEQVKDAAFEALRDRVKELENENARLKILIDHQEAMKINGIGHAMNDWR